MGTVVPNKIHFIWVGGPIPTKPAITVLNWAIRNPGYEVTLWTDKPGVNAEELAQPARRLKNLFTGPTVNELPGGDRALAYVARSSSKPGAIHLKSVQGLSATLGGDLSARAAQECYQKNYGGASDILRIAVLAKEGGLYLDTDSEALAPLPGGVRVDDGILFGRLDNRGFCNAVIAAPAGHRYLAEIAQAMADEFARWSRPQQGAPRQVDQYRKGVDDARAQMATAKTNQVLKPAVAARRPMVTGRRAKKQPLDVSGELSRARQNLQEQLSSGTLVMTGPTRVAIWLYEHVARRPQSLEEFAGERGLDTQSHLQMAQLVQVYQNMVVNEELKKASVVKRYGFPEGHVKVHSDATWIR